MAGDHVDNQDEGDVARGEVRGGVAGLPLPAPEASGELTSETVVELEQMSLYDSLLRAVAVGGSQPRTEEDEETSEVRIHAEVGPSGKFVLLQKIGSGAMGRVYRALDRYLLRDVAIKFILRPDGMNQDDFMALFWQEAHIIARLDRHDNIVRILDVDRTKYPPFIVMEYLDGQSLEDRIRRGPLDLTSVLQLMIGVACGLGEAHAMGVCHRDLKPSNIFLQKTGRVKLLDFGLARIRNHLFETSATRSWFITTRTVPPLASAGTPAYMAPEQWRGEDTDASTDLWALGAILYRLLTRRPAFEATSIVELSDRVLSGEMPTPISVLAPEVPAEICALTQRMLRFDKDQRPRGVSEVIAVLESTLNKTQSSPLSFAATQLVPPSHIDRSFREHRLALGSGRDGLARPWEGMLIVVVGGPDSGTLISLDQLPTWILQSAGVSCDVLQCPPQSGDLPDSALRLRGYLNERLKRPRHIFFVTHGEGTDVVLRILLDEAARLRRVASGDRVTLDAASLFYRTRHVAVLRPGRGVATAHHVAALQPSADSTPLAAELMAEAQSFHAATLPTPAVHYFGLDEERAPLHAGSALVAALATFLVQPEMMLVRETIAQSFELDCAAKIRTLVAPTDEPGADEARPTVLGAGAGTQSEVFEEVLALARTQHQRVQTIAIAGDAGVGKSTVLRMIARRLSSELITDGGAVLPVLIPLYFASLPPERLAMLDTQATGERSGRAFLELVLEWWCQWLSSITYAGSIEPDWIKARLRSEPVVLILDGVDEFITNHPGVRISDFQHLLAFLGVEYRRNGWLTVVLGVRSSQPGLPLLGLSNTREVLRLTTSQAIRHFPGAWSWLGQGSGAPVRKLLFTPLILAQLNARPTRSPSRPSSNDELLVLALTTIIEQSDLVGKLDARGQPIDAQRWIDALTAIAWCLFRRLRSEITTAALSADAAELHRSWRDHLEATQQQTQGEHLLSGFHLLCESRAFEALLHRTVLYPTGREEIRFIHREWQDFLAARYLTQVVVYRHVDEFRHAGNTARISQMAGDLLGRMEVNIDETMVLALLHHAHETGAPLMAANFAAVLTNSRMPIDGPAIDALLSAVTEMPAISRCISLAGLGYRALRGDDASAHDLRHRLVRVFRDYVTAPILGNDLGLMRSLAWCYRKAYARRFGGPPVTDPWPGLHEADDRTVLAMMCSTTPDGPRFLAEHRSVQIALLEVQQTVISDPWRPISGVHYLYCLAVARHHGGGIAELSRELPALLAPGSPYATSIEGYDHVPELRDVLAACRRLELAP